MFIAGIICFFGTTFASPLLNSDVDYVYVDFSDIGSHINRVKRQADSPECTLEDELELPISYKSQQKLLKLQRNKHLVTDNLKVLEENDVGYYTTRQSKKPKNRVSGMYTYTEDGLRYGVMVTCNFQLDCTNPVCEIHGELMSEFELIEIAGSTEEKNAQKSKLGNTIPHNVKKMPGFEYDGTQPDEKDTRIPGLDKTGRPDPRLPPLMPKDRKLKKDDILSAQAKLKLEKEQNLQYLQNLHGKSVFSLSRSKREATQSLFEEDENVITLGITHDLQFFYDFKYQSGVEEEDEVAIELMKEFVVYTCAGIDHRMYNIRKYAPDIKLRVYCDSIIAKYNVSQNDTGVALWSLHPVYLGGEQPHLDANVALDDLSKFVMNNGYLFFGLDHIMAFTGQDLAREIIDPNGNYWQTRIKGYTFGMDYGVLCRQPFYAVSVVESVATGFVSRYATHEIVHNMGVGHDNNASLSCTLTEQFIMVSDVKPATYTYRMNPYRFSECSVQGIRTYLDGLDKLLGTDTNDTVHCLKHDGTLTPFADLEEYRLKGQRYQLSEQCRFLMQDPNSIPCLAPRPSYCWNALYCTWSKDPDYCYAGYAFNGSPCNSTSVCYEGDCIDKADLPNYKVSTVSPAITETSGATASSSTTNNAQTTNTTQTTTQQTTNSGQTTGTETTVSQNAYWHDWAEWTMCSSLCNRKRYRYCSVEKGCTGVTYQQEACTGVQCP